MTERTWGLKERALRSGEIRRVGKEERMKKSALILIFLACAICIGLTACSDLSVPGQKEEDIKTRGGAMCSPSIASCSPIPRCPSLT